MQVVALFGNVLLRSLLEERQDGSARRVREGAGCGEENLW